MRCDDDVDLYDFIVPSIGSASTITTYDKPVRVKPREFPPGFHGANPGPSDEPAPKPSRRRG